jgi:hypothetical protein
MVVAEEVGVVVEDEGDWLQPAIAGNKNNPAIVCRTLRRERYPWNWLAGSFIIAIPFLHKQ